MSTIRMKKRSKKSLLLPLFTTFTIGAFFIFVLISSLNVDIDLAPYPEIHPKIALNGTNFQGSIGFTIPFNISNNSPATLSNIKINASLSIVSIELFNWFPDTTIISTYQYIEKIDSNQLYQGSIYLNVSTYLAILAIFDTYLVLDVEVSLDSHFGFFSFPFHWIGRVQEYWDAPF